MKFLDLNNLPETLALLKIKADIDALKDQLVLDRMVDNYFVHSRFYGTGTDGSMCAFNQKDTLTIINLVYSHNDMSYGVAKQNDNPGRLRTTAKVADVHRHCAPDRPAYWNLMRCRDDRQVIFMLPEGTDVREVELLDGEYHPEEKAVDSKDVRGFIVTDFTHSTTQQVDNVGRVLITQVILKAYDSDKQYQAVIVDLEKWLKSQGITR